MKKIDYQTAYEDHRYLWDMYGPAFDMTGGYQDQEDLHKLLRNPTKATARDCLVDQILYWFRVGPERGNLDDWKAPPDARLVEIADRYDCRRHRITE